LLCISLVALLQPLKIFGLNGTLDDAVFQVRASGSYGKNHNNDGGVLVEEDGASITVIGNAWKVLDLEYTVTPQTVFEFDLELKVEDTVLRHGICLDDNTEDEDIVPTRRCFALAGTGINEWKGVWPRDVDHITSTSGISYHYKITIGDRDAASTPYYVPPDTKIKCLAFVQDSTNSTEGKSVYKNIQLYEAPVRHFSLGRPSSLSLFHLTRWHSLTLTFFLLHTTDNHGKAVVHAKHDTIG